MMEEIILGLSSLHCHRPKILHRDLKTLNVLVTDDLHCRLGDFGLSRFDTSANLQTLTKCRGTYAYIPPEVYEAQKFVAQSDIYAVGIICWEFTNRIVTGTYARPYQEYKHLKIDFQILMAAAKKKLRPTFPEKTPNCLKEMIARCWNHEVGARPNCNQLLNIMEVCRQEFLSHSVEWDSKVGSHQGSKNTGRLQSDGRFFRGSGADGAAGDSTDPDGSESSSAFDVGGSHTNDSGSSGNSSGGPSRGFSSGRISRSNSSALEYK